MFLELINNISLAWYDPLSCAIAFFVGIIINIILLLNDLKYKNKKITVKIIFFRFILLLYIPIIWYFLFMALSIGTIMGSSIKDVDYFCAYSDQFQTKEIKRMDYDIYLQEDGNIHVKQIIEMPNNESSWYRIDFSKMNNWILGGEIIESRNLKIKDAISRKTIRQKNV